MSAIYVEIDEKPVPLRDVCWLEVAPCGCACGIATAESGDRRILTAVDCWSDFFGTKAEREKYRRLGFTFEAVTRTEGHRRLTLPKDCPHDPQYGVPPIPQREGYAWACSGSYRTPASARLHLFPSGRVDMSSDREWRERYPESVALCGAKAWNLSAQWPQTAGRVECSRCIREARSTP